MERSLSCYFQVWSPYYQAALNLENTYSCILKVTDEV